MSKLYLETGDNAIYSAEINQYADVDFSEFENLFFHYGEDEVNNYFGTYAINSKRYCNNRDYYVSIIKLHNFIKQLTK